jgi:tetratricopeptide (TPR) repeat protein
MPNAPTKHTKRQDYALIKERIESLNRDSEKFLTIDTEKSLSLATDALNLSLAIQEAQAEARSRLNIGYACFRLCKYSEALAHVQQAQQIWSQIGDLEAERKAMHCLGNIYTMTSNYTLAKQYYNQAISLAKKVQDNCAEARALTNLGSLAEKEGNYIDALYLIEEAETQTEMKLRLLDIKEQIAVGAFDAIEKRLLAMERNLNPEKT